MVEPHELVSTLRGNALRCRTGLLCLPAAALGSEATIAARLGVEFLDYRDRMLSLVPSNSHFLNLTINRLFCDLDEIANAQTGETCVLIANFDLAAAKLPNAETKTLWQMLLTDFPNKTRALVFCVPDHSDGCFTFQDSETQRMWQHSNRYAVWQLTRGGGQQQ